MPAVNAAVLTTAEDLERRNIALASAVSRKWGHEHDIGCPGDHKLELSWNRLVKYPCPR